MTDQAEALRQLVTQVSSLDSSEEQRGLIGIVGAQSSIGTTTIAVNLAVSLARLGWPITLVDADFQRPATARHLGLQPRRRWSEFLVGSKSIREMLQAGPAGLSVLTGVQLESNDASTKELATERLQEQLLSLAESRLVILDCGHAGDEMSLLSGVDDLMIVTTPAEDCVLAAYSTFKQTVSKPIRAGCWLIINQMLDASEAREASQRVSLSCDRFLNLSLHQPNPLPRDENASEAERAQRPLMLHAPSSPLSRSMEDFANEYTEVRRAFGRAIPVGV
ncbi:MAG: hypothetical protein P8N76_23385 [Pirellulaceae bacterium]|nr:hypothetical protein [Pirellulaceae bacterium]